jgi:hypothetical protein
MVTYNGPVTERGTRYDLKIKVSVLTPFFTNGETEIREMKWISQIIQLVSGIANIQSQVATVQIPCQ